VPSSLASRASVFLYGCSRSRAALGGTRRLDLFKEHAGGGVPLMPFDSTGFRKPTVTVLPPSLAPTEPGREPPQRPLHITIEVRLPAPPRRATGAFWWWFVAPMVIALAAHAQPAQWRCSPTGGTEYCGATDQRGQPWQSRSFQQGGTVFTTITDPNGRERRCESYMLGSDTIMRCEP